MTIFISTHFMNKAARCDRISLMNAGRVPITDTSAAVVASKLNSVGAHRHRAIDPDRYASGAGASMAGGAATRSAEPALERCAELAPRNGFQAPPNPRRLEIIPD